MSRSSVVLRFLAEPSTVNYGGKVHGGTAMKWIDEAAYACSAAWSGLYCVTASVGNINFIHPISIGDLVEVEAKIIKTGTSSMNIHVVVSSGKPTEEELIKTTECNIVMVAVNQHGKPTPVRPFTGNEINQK
jgi:acyl-CoA hydrolase